MKNIMKIVFVIIGALIGAGFASGQEIYLFFYSYGVLGLLGLAICCIFMAFIIYKVILIIENKKIDNYKSFLEELSNKKRKNKYLNIEFITNIIINIFLLITFYVMVAGFGAYFNQELGFSSMLGSIVLATLCFIVFMTNIKGMVKINTFLIPILISFIFLIGYLNIESFKLELITSSVQESLSNNFLLSSILYCSYNSILLIPMLVTLKGYVKTKKEIGIVAILTGAFIFILGTILFFLLSKVDVNISILEMPAVYVISKFFYGLKNIYGFIILSSIFTTSISLGISFLANVTKEKKRYTQIALIMCISSVLVSNFGFSNLVNLLYPFFGYLGLLQIYSILRKKIKLS